MFAVYRQNRNVFLFCKSHNVFAARNERFFICERDFFTGVYRGQNAAKTFKPHYRRNYDVCLAKRSGNLLRFRIGANFTVVIYRSAQKIKFALIRNSDEHGTKFVCLLCQKFRISAAHQRDHAESVGVPANDVKRLNAYRPRTAEYANARHTPSTMRTTVKYA